MSAPDDVWRVTIRGDGIHLCGTVDGYDALVKLSQAVDELGVWLLALPEPDRTDEA